MTNINGGATVITTMDGRQYAGLTAQDVVERIKEDGFLTHQKENIPYMRGVARRCRRMDHVTVRTDTYENFLADLETAGHITIGGGN